MSLSLISVLAATAGLSLQVSSPRTDVLVGEPVKLVLAWKATQEMSASIDGFSSLQVWVDAGSGPKLYREAYRQSEQITSPQRFRAGETIIENRILSRGRIEGQAGPFVFPVAGRYSLRLVLNDPGKKVHAESNVLSFRVAEPSGSDREVLEVLKKDPGIIESSSRVKAILEKHSASPYLSMGKLVVFEGYAGSLYNKRDPKTGESLSHLDQQAAKAWGREESRRLGGVSK